MFVEVHPVCQVWGPPNRLQPKLNTPPKPDAGSTNDLDMVPDHQVEILDAPDTHDPDDEFLNLDDEILDAPDIHDQDDEFTDVEDNSEDRNRLRNSPHPRGAGAFTTPTHAPTIEDDRGLHHSPRTLPTPRHRGPAFEGLETPAHGDDYRLPPPVMVRFAEIQKMTELRRKGIPPTSGLPRFALNSQGHICAICTLKELVGDDDSGSGSGDCSDNFSETEVAEKAKEACLKRRDRNVQMQEEADAEDE